MAAAEAIRTYHCAVHSHACTSLDHYHKKKKSSVIFQEVLIIKMVRFVRKKKKKQKTLGIVAICFIFFKYSLEIKEKLLWPSVSEITEISKYFQLFFTSTH